MKRKKIHSIMVAILMLISASIIISSNVYANCTPQPHSVKGLLKIDGEIAEDGIEITFNFYNEYSTLVDQLTLETEYDGEYNFNQGFEGHEEETIHFTVYGVIPDGDPTVEIICDTIYYYPDELNVNSSGFTNPPDEPTNPSPSDGTTGEGINPALSVYVSDPDGDSMDVSFYDASDDSLIGTDTGVASGSTASVTWSGLSYETAYSWYAIASDNFLNTQSSTWSFTTKAEPYCGDGNCDPGEDCNNCPQDCGECNSGGGGGTNGGGGGAQTSNPKAEAGGDSEGKYYGVIDEVLTFDGSATSGTAPYTYAWDLDDDGEFDDSIDQNPTYSWSTDGQYTITLKVTDSNGKTDTDEATAIISQLNSNPTDPVVTRSMLDGVIATDYEFIAISTDADGDNIKYNFSWGDNTDSETEFVANNTEANATHSWSAAGAYVIGVTAYDDNNANSGITYALALINVTYEEQTDGTIYIDLNNNGSWNKVYDPQTGAMTDYEAPDEEPDETDDTGSETKDDEQDNTIWYLLILLLIVVLIIILLLATRKKEKPKEKQSKGKQSKGKGNKPKK